MAVLFLPGLPRLTSYLHVLSGLLRQRLPRVSAKLHAAGVHPTMWATQWFMTVFAYSFPLHTVARVWDSFLLEGWKVPLRVALALVADAERELLAADGFEALMGVLKRIPQGALAAQPWRLMRAAFHWKFLTWRSCAQLLAEEAWLRRKERDGDVGGPLAGTLLKEIPRGVMAELKAQVIAEGEEEDEEFGEE